MPAQRRQQHQCNKAVGVGATTAKMPATQVQLKRSSSEDEMKVGAFLMMQYNLKVGLQKFGAKGAKAAINKLTQIHIMDT
jgi:hypothetical protein